MSDITPARDLVAASMIIGPRTFVWGARTYIMGVVNCSPESFSGDGVRDADEALALVGWRRPSSWKLAESESNGG